MFLDCLRPWLPQQTPDHEKLTRTRKRYAGTARTRVAGVGDKRDVRAAVHGAHARVHVRVGDELGRAPYGKGTGRDHAVLAKLLATELVRYDLRKKPGL